ncbi:hypothetical protein ABMA27_003686 [Loxostege sticticalis]|uniref:Uncharacterized protein n=1 Tax=Loxostege sticticalis TaxID=481309 RepID=A0ABR3HPW0_LOXSC
MNLDKISQDHQLEGFCRGCLIKYDNPTDLLQYTEKNRRLFVYSTGLQVKRNDTFTFQLCKDCYVNMKLSCKFKKQCRTSDKRFKSFLRLKEISDIDLYTFLKNSDDTLKFPLLSGCSTPANQRNKDDDNESTCTSIQNFMTDILQGTEMPDTEARIIKEVIEEEADVLEESLDSHWLQDDVSIDTDFRLDFSFSPFSTSRSVNNDHCYTPSKQIESGHNTRNNHVKKVLEQLPTMCENGYDSPKENNHAKEVLQQLPTLSENYEDSPKDISINGINEALRDICGKTQIDIEEDYMQDNLIEEHLYNANEEIQVFETDPNMPELGDETENNFPVQNEIDMAVKNIDMNYETEPVVNKKNFYVQNDFTIELEVESFVKQQADYTVMDNDKTEQKNTECSIDKKLKQALENNNKVIQLDDLLESPAGDFPEATGASIPEIEVYPTAIETQIPKINDFPETVEESSPKIVDFTEAVGPSTKYTDCNKPVVLISTPRVCHSAGVGASTPVINNILFGEKLEINDDDNRSNSDHNIGQCIEKFENVEGDIDILEVFFKDEVKKNDQNENTEPGVTELNREEALDSKEKDNSKYYDIEKYICKICNKKCVNERAIKCHIFKIHKIKLLKKYTDVKTNLCPYCSLVVKGRGNFHNHLRTHEKTQKEYKCEVCTLTFSTEWKLRQHAKAHNISLHLDTEKKEEKKKFMCSTCGASFALSCNLTAHARRHAAPALACAHCGMAFHRKYDLQRHERTHTGDRPHICPVPECRRSFTQKYGLVLHMTKHTAEKPYECDYCSSKFAKKWSLVNHIHKSSACKTKREGVVTKEKRIKKYKCYFCNRQYSQKGHLIKHQEKSAPCIKRKEDMVNLNRSTLKVQMPFLYPDRNTELAPTPMLNTG